MPNLRCTLVMKAVTNDERAAGFTDSFYKVGTFPAAFLSLHAIARKRAVIMPGNSRVMALKVSDIDKPGASSIEPVNYVGEKDNKNDIPQMALDCFLFSGDFYKRSVQLRCIPDDMVKGGTFQDGTTFASDVRKYFDKVITEGFALRVVSRDNAFFRVLLVTNAGLCETEIPHGLVVGNRVQFFRTRTVDDKTVSGTWVVQTTPTATSFTVRAWPANFVVERGKVRKYEILFPGATARSLKRVTVRPVGRPSDGYIGAH